MLLKQKIDVAIITALPIEMDQFKPHIKDMEEMEINGIQFQSGTLQKKRAVFLTTGVGQSNAAAKTAAIICMMNPRYLIFSGIAGTTNKDLKIGDVVVGNTVFSVEILSFLQNKKKSSTVRSCRFGTLPPMSFKCDSSMLASCQKISNQFKFNVNVGAIASSDFFPLPSGLPETFDDQIIHAIDMESAAFGQTCNMFNKPFSVIRSISNYVEVDKIVKLDPIHVSTSSHNAALFACTVLESKL